MGKVYHQFEALKTNKKHAFALLIDPDSVSPDKIKRLAVSCEEVQVDFVFFGGSLMMTNHASACIRSFKEVSTIPVVLFPGNPNQVVPEADALLYLSVISSRNPELLIGQHVISSAAIKNSGLEVMSTGYMIIDGGAQTTASYISNSAPIPRNKPDIALATAWAGELQGEKLLYMDAGSGARQPITAEMIKKVGDNTNIPLIIGGGIQTPEKIKENCEAGAQVIVVGDAIEKDLSLLKELAAITKSNPVIS